jgi:5-formyltetrahydrofolate cyclo-ligase
VTPVEPIAATKLDVRGEIIARRARRHPDDTAAAAEAIADSLAAVVAARGADVVSAYVSVTGEPGTGPLLDHLYTAGTRVLLPLLLPDLDLDWAEYQPGAWRPGRYGLVEPTAPALGPDAIQLADVIVCPGVAGTAEGHRLGRGGGSYDRALARALPGSLRCLLLYDDEVLAEVPTEPHDQLIDLIVTPSAVIETSGGRLQA